MTDDDKRKEINKAITRHWDKMLADEKRITSYNYDQWSDLLVFCIEEFLSKKTIDYQYDIAVVNDRLPNYMGRSMSLNLKSQTSPYWNKVRKHLYDTRGVYMAEYNEYGRHDYNEIADPDLTPEQVSPIECMTVAITKLDFYYQALVTDYYLNEMTYKQINKKYNIPLNAVQKDIKNGVKQIQQYCSHFK
jgi:DNA-directed RNA polymerase specialized sigma subunit